MANRRRIRGDEVGLGFSQYRKYSFISQINILREYYHLISFLINILFSTNAMLPAMPVYVRDVSVAVVKCCRCFMMRVCLCCSICSAVFVVQYL